MSLPRFSVEAVRDDLTWPGAQIVAITDAVREGHSVALVMADNEADSAVDLSVAHIAAFALNVIAEGLTLSATRTSVYTGGMADIVREYNGPTEGIAP
jgi:hypothetical protein